MSDEKKKELAVKHKDALQGDIGDLLFLVLKLSNQLGVDAQQGFEDVMKEYEERFPLEKFQNKVKDENTANKDVGYDGKDAK